MDATPMDTTLPPTPKIDTRGSLCHKWFNTLMIAVLTVVVILQNIYLSQQTYTLQAQQADTVFVLRKEIAKTNKLNATIAAFDENVLRFEGLVAAEMETVESQISIVKSSVARFNRTISNGDVIDALRVVQNNMASSRAELLAQLADTRTDMDTMRADMQADHESVMLGLNTTMQGMMTHMSATVASADTRINTELTATEASVIAKMQDTTDSLNMEVSMAKADINNEVSLVQKNMDQYIMFADKKFTAENDFLKYQLAGTFTLLGTLISVWHATAHVRHLHQPLIQRRILAILAMVPIYGLMSWLSLVFTAFAPYLGAVKDIYESYAVYTFFGFLIAVMRGVKTVDVSAWSDDSHIIEILLKHTDPELQHDAAGHSHTVRPPLAFFYSCCGEPSRAEQAAQLIRQCRLLVLQFVLLKPILTLTPFILTFILRIPYDDIPPLSDDGYVNFWAPKLYIMIAQNVSVASAFIGLVSFYHATLEELAWCEPWPKFLCIKGVVFMTFWQGIALSIVSALGLVDTATAASLQDFLVCIEMLLAAVAHYYIFPVGEWADNYKESKQASQIQFRDAFALNDFMLDVKNAFTTTSRTDSLDPKNQADVILALQEVVTKRNTISQIKRSLSSDSLSIDAAAAAAPHLGGGGGGEVQMVSAHHMYTPEDVGMSPEQFALSSSPELRVAREDMTLRDWRQSMTRDAAGGAAIIRDGEAANESSSLLKRK